MSTNAWTMMCSIVGIIMFVVGNMIGKAEARKAMKAIKEVLADVEAEIDFLCDWYGDNEWDEPAQERYKALKEFRAVLIKKGNLI